MNAYPNVRVQRLAAMILLGALSLWSLFVLAQGAPGRDVRMGTIAKISGDTATLTLEKAASTAPGSEALAYRPMAVREGMSVRLVVMMGTSVFSMPVGVVDKVSDDGNSCVMLVDESLLEAAVEDPSSGRKATVRDYFKEGAEISVSR